MNVDRAFVETFAGGFKCGKEQALEAFLLWLKERGDIKYDTIQERIPENRMKQYHCHVCGHEYAELGDYGGYKCACDSNETIRELVNLLGLDPR